MTACFFGGLRFASVPGLLFFLVVGVRFCFFCCTWLRVSRSYYFAWLVWYCPFDSVLTGCWSAWVGALEFCVSDLFGAAASPGVAVCKQSL